MSSAERVRKVVLVGGGHSHVQLLKDFERSPLPNADLTVLVDKPIAVYSGMVPGFVAGQYRAEELQIDVRHLAEAARATLVAGKAVRVDGAAAQILLADGSSVSYDVAAFDIGSTVAGLGLAGVREFTVPTRPIDAFVDRVQAILEKASHHPRDDFRIGVIGGGSGGVELAFTLQRRVTRETSIPVTVLLLEGGPRILKGYPESLVRRVYQSAAGRGIEIRCNQRVEAVEAGTLLMKGGQRIACDAAVWVTGAVSQAIFKESGFKTDPRGFVSTRSTLQVEDHDELFATGDCATLSQYPDTPKAGVYAVRQGPFLSHNLRAFLEDLPLRNYLPQKDFLTLLNLGDGTALGVKWGVAFQGKWVMRLKDYVDRRFMRRFLPALALLGVLTSGQSLTAQELPAPDVEVNRLEMERTEELSESLANQLLDFSVAARNGNLTEMGKSLGEVLQATPLPELEAFTPEWTKGGLQMGHLKLEGETLSTLSRKEWLESWQRFVDSYSHLQDVRFKVSAARFEEQDSGVVAQGQLKFFLVGEKSADRLLWIRGKGRVRAILPPDTESWVISRLQLSAVSLSESSPTPLSEVSSPAGVALTLPRYGSPGNDDFVYHGAAAADVDGDGLLDLFVTGIRRNYLYLNQVDGRFHESGRQTGTEITRPGTSPLFLDYDNDGDLDLFMAAVGDQMLFENRLIPDGELRFRDVSEESAVAVSAVGFTATAGDVNRDGWIDVYVASYNLYGRVMPDSWHQARNGTANLLFINQKDGTFRESARSWGVDDRRWSYSAQFADVNSDGKMDLYVANDFGRNALYINQGSRFMDSAEPSGTLDAGNGMGVSFGDYDNDGDLDLFVTNMSSMAGNRILNRLFPSGDRDDNVLKKLAAGNTLFRKEGNSVFQDVTGQVGPFPGGWAFGGVFVDIDNDGWEDLYAPNGFVSGETMKDT